MIVDIAFWNYDRTRALIDGSVKIPDVELNYRSDRFVGDIFKRMIRDREFAVSELGLTFFLRTFDLEEPPFIAIPVFPNRFFRHASIFVNTASGITSPKDLNGKTVGELHTFGHDAGVWAKGILADDYGVDLLSMKYILGGIETPDPAYDWIPQPHPPGVSVTPLPSDRGLGPMLEAGEISALFSAIVPQCVMRKSPMVRRLFVDYEAVEREYFARTKIFPIMHTVVMRRDFHTANPGLAQALYRGFCEAKDHAVQQYVRATMFHHAPFMLPWFTQLLDEDRALLGDDWWPYGVAANHHTIDTFLRYHYEQGISKRRLTPEELFVPELLAT